MSFKLTRLGKVIHRFDLEHTRQRVVHGEEMLDHIEFVQLQLWLHYVSHHGRISGRVCLHQSTELARSQHRLCVSLSIQRHSLALLAHRHIHIESHSSSRRLQFLIIDCF